MPTWSPDGRHLAFLFSKDGTVELWILDPQTGTTTHIRTQGTLSPYQGIAWQDNQTVVFISDGSVYSAKVINYNLKLLFKGAATWEGFAFNEIGGNNLIFSSSELYPLNQYHPSDLYTLNLSSGAIEQITNTPNISEKGPIFSRDGKSLAYLIVKDKDLEKGKRGTNGIIIKTEDRNSLTYDIPIVEGVNHMSWSPNGKGILVRANYENPGLYYIDLSNFNKSTPPILIPKISNDISTFSWSYSTDQLAIETVGSPQGNALLIGLASNLLSNISFQ